MNFANSQYFLNVTVKQNCEIMVILDHLPLIIIYHSACIKYVSIYSSKIDGTNSKKINHKELKLKHQF